MTDRDIDKDLEAEGTEPKIYEAGFHVAPTVSEEDIEPIVNTIRDLIESNKGMIVSEGSPSLTNIAYSMDHIVANKKSIFNSAYFGWVKFQIEPESISVIKEGLENNENIFRFLIIKTVREDTMAKKPAFRAKKPVSSVKTEVKKEVKKEISEEEVDKVIEELVVE